MKRTKKKAKGRAGPLPVKAIRRGTITVADVKIKKGGVYGTALKIGETYDQYQRVKLLIGFEGDDGILYWFYTTEANLAPGEKTPANDWLTRGDQNNPPESKLAVGSRIAVSAAIKREATKHGVELYYCRRLNDDGGDRIRAVEDQLREMRNRLAVLEKMAGK